MKFDFLSILVDPFVLMFFVVSIGLLVGKVKIGNMNLGGSGTLFVGLVVGWLIYQTELYIVEQGNHTEGYEQAYKVISEGIIHNYFFNTALIFFVASVGLLAAKDMGAVLKKYGVKFIVLGLLITLVGAAVTFGSTLLIKDTNSYEVAGVYTGALTSSPGLGAALETAKQHAGEIVNDYENKDYNIQKKILLVIEPSGSLTPENTTNLTPDQRQIYIMNSEASIGVGHAIGYPFGVIIVILAVNFLGIIFKINIEEEKQLYLRNINKIKKEMKITDIQDSPFNIISFSVTCFFGYLAGSIEINLGPLGYFSLGSTGGVLITGLILGYIGKIGPISFRMDPKILTLIRELSLSFFLGIVGLNYGYKALNALLGSGITLSLLSLIIGLISILAGFIVGRYVFKLDWIILVGAICGGMTSTPGLGAAIDALKSDDPATGYGATYPFALVGMILFTIILHRMPIM